MTDIRSHANLIWSIAELLRGDYRRSEYGRVVQPLVLLRRLDQVLEPTRDAVVEMARSLTGSDVPADRQEDTLAVVAGQPFFNRSSTRFAQLLDDPPSLAGNLGVYLQSASRLTREVIEHYGFLGQVERLDAAGLLYPVIARVCEVDLHPDRVSNLEMGYLFEELIRRFAEQSNETAGEHFTPREVVRLMVELLLAVDDEALAEPGVATTIYDCACGTGGMLSEAADHVRALNEHAPVHVFGQELNPEAYAICLADLLVKGTDAQNIVLGNSLSNDGHADERFHYGIANPPFGVDWTKVEQPVRDEHAQLGTSGRFGAGLPRRSDGQLLFLQHLVAKMRPATKSGGGGRVAIVLNGSPLFTGGAGSGESEIRRWLIESDLLEAVVALPEQLFYNTGIATYVWLLSNRKAPERRGRVQLIDARASWQKMRKSLGEKRREVSDEQIADIVGLHRDLRTEDPRVKLVDGRELGYRTIVVDQPLRGSYELAPGAWAGVEHDKPVARLGDDAAASLAEALRATDLRTFQDEASLRLALKDLLADAGIVKSPAAVLKTLVARCLVRDPTAPILRDAKGAVVADAERRDTENIPLDRSVEEHLAEEVHPFVPGAWVADPEGKVGYEIPFTRLFYEYTPPRSTQEISSELLALEREIRLALAAGAP